MAATQSETDEPRPNAALANLTAFQRDLLHVAADIGPAKGLEIRDQLEVDRDERVNHGRLYPNLDQMVSASLLSIEHPDRRSNLYEVTDRGRREIEAHHDWQQRCMGAGQ